jgi:hypothetical protein
MTGPPSRGPSVEQLGDGATPPYDSFVPPQSDLSRCSMTDEIRAMTSGEISSRLAIREITSTRTSSGSSPTS